MRFSLIALVLLAGCSSFVSMTDTEYEPRPEGWPVEIFVADTAPIDFHTDTTKDESEIPPGAIRVGKALSRRPTYAHMVLGLRETAREYGGDGLLIVSEGIKGAVAIVYRWKP